MDANEALKQARDICLRIANEWGSVSVDGPAAAEECAEEINKLIED